MIRFGGSERIWKLLGSFIRHRPRTVAALAFGTATLVVQHFAWLPHARLSGLVPFLTVAIAMCHAIAGAIAGPRLVDGVRTRTFSQAGLLGAGASLLALMLFTLLFTAYLVATGIHPVGLLSYVVLAVLTAVFAFVGDAWALLLVSIGVAWTLYRVAACEAGAGRRKD